MELPIGGPAAGPNEVSPGTAPTARRVLVVDDEVVSRRVISAMIEAEGCRADTASSGTEALRRFGETSYDLVLLDLHMPETDGYRVARVMRELAGNRLVPIIFLTAETDEDALAECLKAGGDDFLNKPVSRTILGAKIRAMERLRRLHATISDQLRELRGHHERLLHEKRMSLRLFGALIRRAELDAADLGVVCTPEAAFDGDLVLAARRPNGSRLVLHSLCSQTGLVAAVSVVPLAERFHDLAGKGYGVREIVTRLDDDLRELSGGAGARQVTIVEADSAERHLTVWAGGGLDVLVRRHGAGRVERVPALERPLGGRHPVDPSPVFLELARGDRVLVVSPRTAAVVDDDGQSYGFERIASAFAASEVAERFVTDLAAEISAFVGHDASEETVLAEIRALGPSSKAAADPAPGGAVAAPDAPACRIAFDFGAPVLSGSDPLPPINQFLSTLPGLGDRHQDLYLILSELFFNALDHGLLRLDSSLKDEPEGFARYYELRERRRAALSDGTISIAIEYAADEERGSVRIRVVDTGAGFDHRTMATGEMSAATMTNGRGIPLLKSLCREVRYLGSGNAAEVLYDW